MPSYQLKRDDPTGLGADERPDDSATIERDTSDLIFPIFKSDEIGNRITIERKKYDKIAVDDPTGILVNAKGSRKITLPVPPELQQNYAAEWENNDMGAWGNFYRAEGGELITKGLDMYRSGKAEELYNQANLASASTWIPDGSKIMDFGSAAVKAYASEAFLGLDTFRKVGGFTGMARNPFKAVLFSSPMFRSFQFQWKLVAKSYKEAVAIKNIVQELKIGMSPRYSDLFDNNIFEYPDIFVINFTDDSFLFKFKPCILSDMRADYNTEAQVFFGGPNGEKIPSTVMVSAQFREIVLLTREDFEDKGF